MYTENKHVTLHTLYTLFDSLLLLIYSWWHWSNGLVVLTQHHVTKYVHIHCILLLVQLTQAWLSTGTSNYLVQGRSGPNFWEWSSHMYAITRRAHLYIAVLLFCNIDIIRFFVHPSVCRNGGQRKWFDLDTNNAASLSTECWKLKVGYPWEWQTGK